MVFSFLIFFNIIFLERLLIAAEGTMFFARVCLCWEEHFWFISEESLVEAQLIPTTCGA